MYLHQPTSIPNRITLPPALPHPSFKPPRISCCHATARDRVIDFGKYKGRMLGTLPSSYLRWVSNNLRAGDFEHWSSLADQVLRDPVYGDRIEWESAVAVLNGNNGGRIGDEDGGAVAELMEISERFGWDYEDKAGWSRVDFELLGTSRGGRIPRVGGRCRAEVRGGKRGGRAGEVVTGNGERRKGRRERAMSRMKKDKGAAAADGGGGDEIGEGEDEVESEKKVYNPFPGREALVRKVLNTRRRSSLR